MIDAAGLADMIPCAIKDSHMITRSHEPDKRGTHVLVTETYTGPDLLAAMDWARGIVAGLAATDSHIINVDIQNRYGGCEVVVMYTVNHPCSVLWQTHVKRP